MDILQHFETVGERGYFRPKGSVSLVQAVAMIDAALEFACTRGLRAVVVNVTELTGFASPSVVERYDLMTQWAYTVRGRARVAVVARPELIDPEGFDVMVAANRGLVVEVFESEADALVWLERKANARARHRGVPSSRTPAGGPDREAWS